MSGGGSGCHAMIWKERRGWCDLGKCCCETESQTLTVHLQQRTSDNFIICISDKFFQSLVSHYPTKWNLELKLMDVYCMPCLRNWHTWVSGSRVSWPSKCGKGLWRAQIEGRVVTGAGGRRERWDVLGGRRGFYMRLWGAVGERRHAPSGGNRVVESENRKVGVGVQPSLSKSELGSSHTE